MRLIGIKRLARWGRMDVPICRYLEIFPPTVRGDHKLSERRAANPGAVHPSAVTGQRVLAQICHINRPSEALTVILVQANALSTPSSLLSRIKVIERHTLSLKKSHLFRIGAVGDAISIIEFHRDISNAGNE